MLISVILGDARSSSAGSVRRGTIQGDRQGVREQGRQRRRGEVPDRHLGAAHRRLPQGRVAA